MSKGTLFDSLTTAVCSLSSGGTAVRLLICAALFSLCVASHVVAQDSSSRPKAEIKMIIGGPDFGTDNESYPHFVIGTATRIHISRHWSIEPEFSYMRRSLHIISRLIPCQRKLPNKIRSTPNDRNNGKQQHPQVPPSRVN